jgi:putative transposase
VFQKEQRIKLTRLHEQIADICKARIQKMITKLVQENQLIAIETLNVKSMMQNHKLASAISDASWGRLAFCNQKNQYSGLEL